MSDWTKGEANSMAKEIVALRAEVEQLRRWYRDAEEKAAVLEGECDGLRRALDEARASLAVARAEIGRWRKAYSETFDRAALAQAECARLREEGAAARERGRNEGIEEAAREVEAQGRGKKTGSYVHLARAIRALRSSSAPSPAPTPKEDAPPGWGACANPYHGTGCEGREGECYTVKTTAGTVDAPRCEACGEALEWEDACTNPKCRAVASGKATERACYVCANVRITADGPRCSIGGEAVPPSGWCPRFVWMGLTPEAPGDEDDLPESALCLACDGSGIHDCNEPGCHMNGDACVRCHGTGRSPDTTGGER